MNVTPEVKQRVVAKLKEGIAIANAHYGINIQFPTVVYDKRGGTAGVASYRTWTIDLNAQLLMENIDAFIARTVPHELAHLICHIVYPQCYETEIIRVRGRLKRSKRDVHGSYWQEIMRVLGVADSTRCHSYDVSTSKVVKSTSRQIKFKCTGCSAPMLLTPLKAARLAADPRALWHRGCRGALLVRDDGVQEKAPVKVVDQFSVIPPAPKAIVPRRPALMNDSAAPTVGGSKLDMCKALYQKFQGTTYTRSDIINAFVGVAGCTGAGAATYYATCKKLFG